MTYVNVQYKSDSTLIKVMGHANYATHGCDIVCAAISTACILSTNLIERLTLSAEIKQLICEEGDFQLEVKNSNFTINTIIENLIATLSELQKQYPKYIKFEN